VEVGRPLLLEGQHPFLEIIVLEADALEVAGVEPEGVASTNSAVEAVIALGKE
jgi:hypothetical protein